MGVMEKGPSNTSIEDAFSREGFFFIRNMRMSYSHEQYKDLKGEKPQGIAASGGGVEGLPSQVEE